MSEFSKYQPYWIHKRFAKVADAQNKNYLIHKLDYGLNYLLRRVLIKASYVGFGVMPSITIMDTNNNKPKLSNIPTNLISTPGNNNRVVSGEVPVYDEFSPALPPISTKTLNFVFASGFNINIEITSPPQSVFTPIEELKNTDIVLVGYYIPNEDVPMYKGLK